MNKARLEAFTDGVMAIIITIMVLELKSPHAANWGALAELWPVFISYILSFTYVGIYWMAHHNLLHASRTLKPQVLLANLHLLFWLSLLPFSTGWMSETQFSSPSVMLFGANLIISGLAYLLLQSALIFSHGKTSEIASALAGGRRGTISLIFYAAGMIAAASGFEISAFAIFWIPALIWLVPDWRLVSIKHSD